MSQHLIDTERNSPGTSAQDRSSGMRPDGTDRGYAHAANGMHSNGGSGTANGARSEGRDEPSAGSAGGTSAARSPGDATLRALDALSAALAEMTKDERLLEQRLKDLHRQRSEGRSWNEILGEEDPPGTMQLVSRILACLAKASGLLRKELVDSLRREGVSIPAIARLFGVTHQRVSNLLRRPAG